MRKPNVPNKYNLTRNDLRHLAIIDRSQICEPLFWRNNVIDAWCISGGSGKGLYSEWINSFWIGVYDKSAKAYAGKVKVDFSACEDMCSYNFEKFYAPEDIESDIDLAVQEKFLLVMNELLDKKILGVQRG